MKANINGTDAVIEPGWTILEAARRHGHFIPTLCELADLHHAPATCRVCLVEIRNAPDAEPRIVTACNTPVEDGMIVRTRTREVRRMQRLQVELILADHDRDCATCVRHGDCELQDLARFVGLEHSRHHVNAASPGRTVDRSSHSIVRDMNKCVRCMRCLNVCRNVQGVDALVVTGECLHTEIGLRRNLLQGESECISCGQCTLVCPVGALAEKDDVEQVIDFLYDDTLTTVFQFAPAVRIGLGEEFGLPAGTNVEGLIVSALKRLGADFVVDTNFAADLVIMEEGTELLHRIKTGAPLPMFTSCCPGWVNFVEKRYPALLPHVSSTRSPQQCLGSMAKTYLARSLNLDPARMRVISIMPCTAKKDEAARPQFLTEGRPDVDTVLTTREFARLLKREGVNLAALAPQPSDNPFMSDYSGAGAIFGTTGGVMEAALRTVYHVINGREMERLELTELRGFENVRQASVDMGPALGQAKVCIAHGLKGAARLAEAVLAGQTDGLHFIEVMACPGGCMAGGGQPRGKRSFHATDAQRRQALFSIDRSRSVRQSHNNPQVKKLYTDFLDAPNSHLAHVLLHTGYADRHLELAYTMKDIWQEISLGTRVHGEYS